MLSLRRCHQESWSAGAAWLRQCLVWPLCHTCRVARPASIQGGIQIRCATNGATHCLPVSKAVLASCAALRQVQTLNLVGQNNQTCAAHVPMCSKFVLDEQTMLFFAQQQASHQPVTQVKRSNATQARCRAAHNFPVRLSRHMYCCVGFSVRLSCI